MLLWHVAIVWPGLKSGRFTEIIQQTQLRVAADPCLVLSNQLEKLVLYVPLNLAFSICLGTELRSKWKLFRMSTTTLRTGEIIG